MISYMYVRNYCRFINNKSEELEGDVINIRSQYIVNLYFNISYKCVNICKKLFLYFL